MTCAEYPMDQYIPEGDGFLPCQDVSASPFDLGIDVAGFDFGPSSPSSGLSSSSQSIGNTDQYPQPSVGSDGSPPHQVSDTPSFHPGDGDPPPAIFLPHKLETPIPPSTKTQKPCFTAFQPVIDGAKIGDTLQTARQGLNYVRGRVRSSLSDNCSLQRALSPNVPPGTGIPPQSLFLTCVLVIQQVMSLYENLKASLTSECNDIGAQPGIKSGNIIIGGLTITDPDSRRAIMQAVYDSDLQQARELLSTLEKWAVLARQSGTDEGSLAVAFLAGV